MKIFCLDEAGCLFLSPRIEDWKYVEEHGITVVIDLEGEIDRDIPTMPNHILYVYFPIYDEDLPDMAKLHGVARMAASLVAAGHKVLSHCGMGFNRSALLAGLILRYLGMSGPEVVEHLRQRRPGALFNEVFAAYLVNLEELPPSHP
ncbi:MAG TPA: dual specificity protein phosphatase family protein [Thermoanaerobaculia bacterium]|jgi:protein-tyrosine phosphatase|nr:dual specificity protein phosphatase family protein [Thermoanaerobaculia bacterium]